MKPLEVWTCQRAENLKKKSSKIPKNNYAATRVPAARRQISGGGGAPINKSRRRPQIVGGGAARPAHGSRLKSLPRRYSPTPLCRQLRIAFAHSPHRLTKLGRILIPHFLCSFLHQPAPQHRTTPKHDHWTAQRFLATQTSSNWTAWQV